MTSRTQHNDPNERGYLPRDYHLEMLLDQSRVDTMRRAINATCNGRIVFESGLGSGVMSISAALAGANHVYATEIDPEMAKVARGNIRRNNLRRRITLIEDDTRNVTLADIGGGRADLCIVENLSTLLLEEPQVLVMNHVNKHLLKKDGTRLPEKISNTVQLVQEQYAFVDDKIQLKAFSTKFTGVQPTKLFSEPVVFHEVDFSQRQPKHMDISVIVKATRTGVVNAVLLTSPMEIFPEIRFEASDTLMPPVSAPLKKPRGVSEGQNIELRLRYTHGGGWKTLRSEIV